jgi:hypothetical protein
MNEIHAPGIGTLLWWRALCLLGVSNICLWLGIWYFNAFADPYCVIRLGLLVHQLGVYAGLPWVQHTAWIITVCTIVAQAFCWHSILTLNHITQAVESLLWAAGFLWMAALLTIIAMDTSGVIHFLAIAGALWLTPYFSVGVWFSMALVFLCPWHSKGADRRQAAASIVIRRAAATIPVAVTLVCNGTCTRQAL